MSLIFEDCKMDSRFRGNDEGGASATPNRERHDRNGMETDLVACVGSGTPTRIPEAPKETEP